jgi:transcriptional regulator PpsR
VDKLKTQNSIGELDAESAATLIAAAADVTLVLDGEGMILDVAVGGDDPSLESFRKWIGQAWVDTVTTESRPKIESLLTDGGGKAIRKWRHVNHTSFLGPDVPVLYSTVRLRTGRFVAFGRDLRPNALLQQKLIDAQNSMERDYWRLRHVEMRYRLLFQMSSEAVLILDASSQKILEANAAAGTLFGESAKQIIGRKFPAGFDADGLEAIQSLLAGVRAVGVAEQVRARLASSPRECVVSASLFRQENASFMLVRIASTGFDTAESPISRSILKVMESAPDAFIVTDLDGRIIAVNTAFMDLAQVAKETQVRGESLDRWLGRSGVDFNVLISNLRQHGSIRLFASVLRGEHGADTEVEVSAVSVPNGAQPCIGFTVRNVGHRFNGDTQAGLELPRSPNQLTALVGRVPLKELVRESVDLVERRCIEAALELTRDNRASAAEMLGLSRQSFYVKLRRYGLGDLELESEEP